MIDVSFFLPGIRTHMWEKFYETAKLACQNHTFEVVIVSPFEPPDSLKNVENFHVIKDWGCPTRCAQIAAANCKGRLLYHTVDDGYFYKGSIDVAIDLYDKLCTKKDMINMRYREAPDFGGTALPLNFWDAWSSEELQLPGISKNWKISLHFLINREQFVAMGGFDCQFEYLNHPLHDFAFRMQAAGGKILHSPLEVISCTHYPDQTVDHGPIHVAQIFHDSPIFCEIYKNPSAATERYTLDYDNWKKCDEAWDRRFKGKKPASYSEMLS